MAHVFEPKFPFWKTVIFVDWHGVLSRDPFWVSILAKNRHPAQPNLQKEAKRLFGDGELVDRWMRGEITSREIVGRMEVSSERFGHRYIERKLFEDCERMDVNQGLVSLLTGLADRAFIVIATDNMDCFHEQLLLLRSARRPGRRNGERTNLAHFARHFDDVLCSSALGTLKSEQPAEFFGRWLHIHELSFARSLLLDDNKTNCVAFEEMGGTAIRVTDNDFSNGYSEAAPSILNWLDLTVPKEQSTSSAVVESLPYSRRRQLRLPI